MLKNCRVGLPTNAGFGGQAHPTFVQYLVAKSILENTLANWVAKPIISSTLSVLMRAMLAAIFIISGFGKMQDYAGTAGYMSSMSVSASLLPLVILLEFGGGLAVLLGFQTRFAALALAVFSVASAFIFHSGQD